MERVVNPHRDAEERPPVPEACPGCGVMMSWGLCGMCRIERLAAVEKAAREVAGSGLLAGDYTCVPNARIAALRDALAKLDEASR